MPLQNPVSESVTDELSNLPRNSIRELRAKWRTLFGNEPPPAFGPDLLRRSIAQKLQEDAYGKLSPPAQRELNRIVAALAKNPAAKLELPRRIKAGAVLVRDWKGTTHRVTIVENGFSYHDSTYVSLSEIAREITGTRWNGPRFFGLRSTSCPHDDSSADTAAGKRGHPTSATRETNFVP